MPTALSMSATEKSKRMRKPDKSYLLSLPERSLRALTALAAGLVRESSEVTLPLSFRRTRIYQSIAEQSLRFLIEKVGKVEGAYDKTDALPDDFLVRRTAGNGVELISLAVFHASPVWVLAGLADVSGAGGKLLAEISETLEKEGWLRGASFVSFRACAARTRTARNPGCVARSDGSDGWFMPPGAAPSRARRAPRPAAA